MTLHKRSDSADFLKGLAVIFMIQVHITELLATPEFYDSVAGKVSLFFGGTPAAPAFMSVMGFFIFRSGKGLAAGILRGLQLIGGGLLLNAGLNAHALFRIATGNLDIEPLKLLLGVDILFLAGFSVILLSLLKKLFPKNPAPFLLLIVLAAGLPLWMPPQNSSYLLAFFIGNASWSYFPLFPWLAYPAAAYAAALMLENENFRNTLQRFRLVIYSTALLVLTAGSFFAVPLIYNLQSWYHHSAFLVLWNLLFLFLLTGILPFISDRMRGFFGDFIRWTGKNVTAIYVFQWLIIGNIATAVFRSVPSWTLPLWFFGVLLVSCLLAFGYESQRRRHKAGVVL